MLCEFAGTQECDCKGGCHVKFIEPSKLDNVLCFILAGLLWIPIVAIWHLAIGIDKIIELLHGKQR